MKWTGNQFMIECYGCKNWYHPKCIGLTPIQLNDAVNDDEWKCKYCQ